MIQRIKNSGVSLALFIYERDLQLSEILHSN